MSLEETKKIFLFSDPHFDHTNIIKYCHRPFSSVEQMNEKLLSNWKSTITKNDAVIFLGDMAFGKNCREPRWWLTQLPFKDMIYIRGSHDHGIQHNPDVSDSIEVLDSLILRVENMKLLLSHQPLYWNGLNIHGHLHNNSKPFIYKSGDGVKINISCELTNYTPLTLFQCIEACDKITNIM